MPSEEGQEEWPEPADGWVEAIPEPTQHQLDALFWINAIFGAVILIHGLSESRRFQIAYGICALAYCCWLILAGDPSFVNKNTRGKQ